VLVRGSIRLFFASGDEALLVDPGDYALWPPGVAHRWEIEQEDTIVLTVRWPSPDTMDGQR
jgi:quercetin dioxygenase-like cupin family protein